MADAIGSLFIDLSMQTASFDAATKRVEAQVRGFTSKIQSGFGALKGVIASAGLVVAAQQIGQFAQSMGEAADQVEDLASTLGTSIQKVLELQGVFRLTSGSAAEASAAILKMNGVVADARSGNQAAIDTLKQVNVSLEDLARVGDDPVDLLKLFGDRWTSFQDGAAKSAAFADVFGRGLSRIVPVLREGGAGVDRLVARFNELDPAAAKAHENAAALDTKIGELTVTTKGLINEALDAIGPLFKSAGSEASGFAAGLRDVIGVAQEIIGPLQEVGNILNAINNFTSGGWRKNLIGGTTEDILKARDGIGTPGPLTEGGFVPERPAIGPLPTMTSQKKGGGGGGRKGGGGSGTDEWKDAADAMRELAEEQADAARQLADNMQSIFDEQSRRKIQQIKHELDIEKITGQQAIDAERRVADEKWLAHQEFFRKKREAAEGDQKKITELNQEEKVAYERHLTELGQLSHDKVKLRFDEFKDAARDLGNVLENSFSNAFDGITEGTFKLRTAIGGLLKDLGRMIANKAFQMLLNGGSGSSSGGGLLGSLFGLFTGGGGGGKGGPFGDGWSAAELGMPALASGGSFRVGGSGGIDSQLIAARMTPGELVEVTPPGQAGGMGSEVIALNLSTDWPVVDGRIDKRIVTASGQIIKVSVAQSTKAVQRNWQGMSGEAQQRQL